MTSSKLSILVIDEKPEGWRDAASALEHAGYTVAQAAESREALRLVGIQPPDLVFLDGDRPESGGVQLGRLLKQKPGCEHLFLVLVSSEPIGAQPQLQNVEAGMDGYVSRPFSNQELLARVSDFARILSLERVQRAQASHLVTDADVIRKSRLASLNLARDSAVARERAEHATLQMRTSESRYRRLFETAKDGILILDAETGAVVDVNPYLTEMLGYSAEDLVGKQLWELGVFKDIVANQEGFAELQTNEYIRYEDRPLKTSEGSIIEVEFISNVYLVDQQKVIQCNIRNITTRKAAERELELQARLGEGLLMLSATAEKIDETAFLKFGLELAEDLTSSQFGGMFFVRPGQESIELFTLSKRTFDLGYGDPAWWDALFQESWPWAAAIRDKKPVWAAGSAPAQQALGGRAEGAPFGEKSQLLAVPVIKDGQVVMILGLGKSPSAYSVRHVSAVQLIGESVWRIFQRRRIERELRLTHSYLAALYNSIPMGIISYDHRGQPQTVNPAAAFILGTTMEQLLTHNLHADQIWNTKEVLALAEKSLEQNRWGQMEQQSVAGANKRIWLNIQCVPFPRGEQRHLLILLTDIAGQNEATAKLRLQSAALAAAANVIVITDAEGTIEYVNEAFTHTTGYSLEEALGKNPRILKSDRHPREFYESMWQTILAGKVWHGEIHNRRKNGQSLEEDTTITPVRNTTGTITHYIAIKQDVTEKRIMEKQFLRAQRMESIGMLAGGIAHDLNNVLAPVLMGADLVKMMTSDPLIIEQLERMSQSARRGADIVKQVLTFARGIQGERIAVQPDHLIKEMVRMARETFPRNLRIQQDIPKNLWPILGDPTQLHQVLLNLCVNARDAMLNGGELSLSARNLEVDGKLVMSNPGAKPGPHVVLTVRDTGAGISPQILEHMFEPFYTTKEPGKGTGLGLSTVQGIVRSHEGFITVQTQLKEGTTFSAYFPAHPQGLAAEGLESAAPALPRGQGERVLLVDDEPAILKVTQAMLESHGYQVFTATDGTAALAELSQHTGDVKLILTDIVMPFMDGVQLIRVARRLAPNIPIIACTGAMSLDGQQDRTEQVRSLGVKHILLKPYSTASLLRALQEELHPDATPHPSP